MDSTQPTREPRNGGGSGTGEMVEGLWAAETGQDEMNTAGSGHVTAAGSFQ